MEKFHRLVFHNAYNDADIREAMEREVELEQEMGKITITGFVHEGSFHHGNQCVIWVRVYYEPAK
ncbi:MAG: hypothetical protein AAB483_04085 [Patescibacteria group bacterium]